MTNICLNGLNNHLAECIVMSPLWGYYYVAPTGLVATYLSIVYYFLYGLIINALNLLLCCPYGAYGNAFLNCLLFFQWVKNASIYYYVAPTGPWGL